MVAATMPPAPPSQDSIVVAESAVAGATVVSVPSLLRTTSAVMTELSLAVSIQPFLSLFPCVQASCFSPNLSLMSRRPPPPTISRSCTPVFMRKEVARPRLPWTRIPRPSLSNVVRSCLDTAMALGLLDSAQLDELQPRLAEGEEMIGRYA
ncbi:uncharacterized protein Pyn_40212 [Prunus yedoensis var. nudiflora]|uniref:Uncharacterized protein n=1 Tax=Prunus yedoensis var. nudiflora TaxID=2094558 RepID=A0A314Y1T4_PRUYE|nr:uncharacterized protein Pyn_40212 [Prunus yedoensis var. nudiflora]